jgi:small subunit ribosomal protein S3
VGQKVHPYGFRLGYNKDWHSHWFTKKQYGDFLHEDLRLKKEIKGRFAGAGVSHVDVERAANRLNRARAARFWSPFRRSRSRS